MEMPFVGTVVSGPDAQGETTQWSVISSHPVAVGFAEGGLVLGGWVAWLTAQGRPMLCVGSGGFEGEEPSYHVVAKSPLQP